MQLAVISDGATVLYTASEFRGQLLLTCRLCLLALNWSGDVVGGMDIHIVIANRPHPVLSIAFWINSTSSVADTLPLWAVLSERESVWDTKEPGFLSVMEEKGSFLFIFMRTVHCIEPGIWTCLDCHLGSHSGTLNKACITPKTIIWKSTNAFKTIFIL